MQYHNYVINLLEEPMATKLEKPKYAPLVAQAFDQQPRNVLSTSKRMYETLVRIYYLRYGFEALDGFMVVYLSFLAFMAHGHIKSGIQDIPIQALQSSIVLATIGLADQSHSHYTCQMAFSAVRSSMTEDEIALIDRFAGQNRAKNTHPPEDWQNKSTWSMDFGSIFVDREMTRLGKLFENTSIDEVREVQEREVRTVSEVHEG